MTKTVKVRVAVAVSELGMWSASGYTGGTDGAARKDATEWLDGYHGAVYWLTAELSIPEPQEVAADVEEGRA